MTKQDIKHMLLVTISNCVHNDCCRHDEIASFLESAAITGWLQRLPGVCALFLAALDSGWISPNSL